MWRNRPLLLERGEVRECGMDLSLESGCLKLQPKVGGKLHLRLNMTTRPIANKYREGKLKQNPEERVQENVKPLRA